LDFLLAKEKKGAA